MNQSDVKQWLAALFPDAAEQLWKSLQTKDKGWKPQKELACGDSAEV